MAKKPQTYANFLSHHFVQDSGAGSSYRANVAWSKLFGARLAKYLAANPDASNKQAADHFRSGVVTIVRWRKKLQEEGRSGYHQPRLLAAGE